MMSYLVLILVVLSVSNAQVNPSSQEIYAMCKFGEKIIELPTIYPGQYVCQGGTPIRPICGWTGVTCSNATGVFHVSEISIPGLSVSGTLDPSVSLLLDLRRLNLSNNILRGSLPTFVGTSLSSIDLSHNLFAGDIPDYSQLPLQYIDISSNLLTKCPDAVHPTAQCFYESNCIPCGCNNDLSRCFAAYQSECLRCVHPRHNGDICYCDSTPTPVFTPVGQPTTSSPVTPTTSPVTPAVTPSTPVTPPVGPTPTPVPIATTSIPVPPAFQPVAPTPVVTPTPATPVTSPTTPVTSPTTPVTTPTTPVTTPTTPVTSPTPATPVTTPSPQILCSSARDCATCVQLTIGGVSGVCAWSYNIPTGCHPSRSVPVLQTVYQSCTSPGIPQCCPGSSCVARGLPKCVIN